MSNYTLPGYDNWLTTNRGEDEWQLWCESDFATLAHVESESELSFDDWLDTDEAFTAYTNARYDEYDDYRDDEADFDERLEMERNDEPVSGFDY